MHSFALKIINRFTMYNIIQHTHSGIMWLVIIMLIISVFGSLIKLLKKQETISSAWYKVYSYTKWLIYFQFILGAVLFFISPKIHFGEGFMKNSELRFYGMEHPLMMLIAVGLIALGLFMAKKKATAMQKNRTVFIYYAISLVLIATMIPWKTVLS